MTHRLTIITNTLAWKAEALCFAFKGKWSVAPLGGACVQMNWSSQSSGGGGRGESLFS